MTRIQLSDERKKAILVSLMGFYDEAFDEKLSEFQANRLLEFFVRELGPSVYNQGVQDARAFVLDKLDDLEGDVYEMPAD
ncbi:DUF2164 domain-containing protein [Candidatus Latescibacterota bacterium]